MEKRLCYVCEQSEELPGEFWTRVVQLHYLGTDPHNHTAAVSYDFLRHRLCEGCYKTVAGSLEWLFASLFPGLLVGPYCHNCQETEGGGHAGAVIVEAFSEVGGRMGNRRAAQLQLCYYCMRDVVGGATSSVAAATAWIRAMGKAKALPVPAPTSTLDLSLFQVLGLPSAKDQPISEAGQTECS